MKLRLLLALLLGALAAPATSAANPAREITRTGVPGAVVLDDERVYAAGNVRATDRFRVGSITKTFVAATVLQLVAEKRLALDERVPEAGGVPLRTLLNHTSGLSNHAEDPRVIAGGLLKQWKPRELVAIAREHPPYFEPGAGFHYSNTNYVVLGLVIERVTGKPLARVLERRLLRPLGLRNTSYDESPDIRGLAPGLRQNTSWAGAAGALVSTAHDVGRFYRALLSGGVLEAPQLAAMKTRDPVAESYGLGLFSVPTSCGEAWGHNGMVPGYNSNAYSSGDGTRRAVVLVNEQPLSERQTAAVNRALDAALC